MWAVGLEHNDPVSGSPTGAGRPNRKLALGK
jgi:hypothetical protein